jgi:hypothetical protein
MARIGGERTPTRNLGGMSVRDPGRTADSPRMLLAIERVGVAGPLGPDRRRGPVEPRGELSGHASTRNGAGTVPLRPSEVAIALALPPAARGSAGLSSRRPKGSAPLRTRHAGLGPGERPASGLHPAEHPAGLGPGERPASGPIGLSTRAGPGRASGRRPGSSG